MKKKVLLCGVVLASMCLLLTGCNKSPEETLKEETEKIAKLDLLSDNIDMNIRNKDEYGVIEQSIKEYLNNYSNNLKEINNILEEEKMQKILSIDNYKNDGPEFENSKKYIQTVKEKFNSVIEKLISLTSENEMMKPIQDKNLNEEFLNLYKELMLGDQISDELSTSIEYLKETQESVNNIFSVQEKVLNLLQENKNKWSINDKNTIEFSDEDVGNKYNSYIEELTKTVEKTDNKKEEKIEDNVEENASNEENAE